MDKKTILLLALSTLVGFGGLGYGIMEYWMDINFINSLKGQAPYHEQLLIGGGYGIFVGFMAMVVIRYFLTQETIAFFVDKVKPLQLGFIDILFISFCAGVGEEILFRGAIQPVLGVWFTSLIFVALHGYITPYNWGLTKYGLFMTVAIAGIGYLTNHSGLFSAIIAHMMVDVILLKALTEGYMVPEAGEHEGEHNM